MGDLNMVGVEAKEFQVCQEIRLALPASSPNPDTLSLAEIPVASPFLFVHVRSVLASIASAHRFHYSLNPDPYPTNAKISGLS